MLRRAIYDQPAVAPVCRDVPAGVSATLIETWRDKCYRGGVADSDDAGAKRQAFHRAKRYLLDNGHIGLWEEVVWIADKGTAAVEPTAKDRSEVSDCPF